MNDRARHALLTDQYLLRLRTIKANPGLYPERRIWITQARMISAQSRRLSETGTKARIAAAQARIVASRARVDAAKTRVAAIAPRYRPRHASS